MPPDPVVAAPDTLEARFAALGVGGQSPLHRRPEQRLTRELACSRVNLSRPHRLASPLEYQRHGRKHWAHFGRNRTRCAGIHRGPWEQLVVESAYPRELNPGSRV